MEVSALKHHGPAGLRGPTPLLRLQGDERLVALTRRGNQAAYEALVGRYQSRLLAFCRHMLGSREDAEDVLQEVFAAAFNAMVADDRPINVRPWLYRIARNRCLNHLRRQTAIGVDSMDVHLADHGTTTADRVHDREEFRELVADVQTLAENQRTALLLREIDALSYEQIAEAMETTVPSVKSLLVRARVALAEAAEARRMTCDEVREELGEWAEGLKRISPPVRRHVRTCERCGAFKKQLSQTNKALAAMFPLGPLLLLKKFLVTHGASGAAAGASGAAAATGASAVGGATASGALSASIGAVASKAAAGLAAVAIVTTGAVEVDHAKRQRTAKAEQTAPAVAPAAAVAATAPPVVVATTPQPAPVAEPHEKAEDTKGKAAATVPAATTPAPATTDAATTPAATAPAPATAPATVPATPQEGFDSTRLPDQPATVTTGPAPTAVVPVTPTPSPTPQPPAASPTTEPPASPAPEPPPATASTDAPPPVTTAPDVPVTPTVSTPGP